MIWVYVSEVFPNRVRSKGQALGSSAHWVTNAIISLVFPVMAGSSGAYPFMFFAAMMVVHFFLILKDVYKRQVAGDPSASSAGE